MNKRSSAPPGAVTRLLEDYSNGHANSLDQVVAIVYDELRRLAHAHLRRSGVGQHVQTTALVHEAYAKLVDGPDQRLNDKRHFFAVASRAMRQVVVGYVPRGERRETRRRRRAFLTVGQ